jgi:hypothetical protein
MDCPNKVAKDFITKKGAFGFSSGSTLYIFEMKPP